ncbi:MAG: SUMF1/EgtB/PvdO family nonheme iron enzyme [Desulfobacterales bacterium]|nr:SUMF1/EgtB/PvdO family nonheme iron enzyme [Desulfobacterales bacterium]
MKLHCLHLSDLHLTGKDPAGVFSQDAVTGSMLRLISELENRPDFVIITGDLAYSGKPEEYEIVHKFCEQLLKAAKLEQERLFIVPGNHDADRSEVRPKHIKSFYPFESQDDITETFTDPDIFPILMRKFSGFSPFAEKAAGRNLFDDSKLWLAKTLCLGEHRINLIGLNSCLFAGYDGDDRQKLALGLYQVEKALKGMDEKAFLSIGFFHHPFSCFHTADKVCENLLTNRLDLILTGHLHEPGNAFVKNAAGQAVVVSAGASYESRESRNSFNFIEIDTETGTGRVQFYKYLPEHHKWKKDTDVNPDEADGSFSFVINADKKYQDTRTIKESLPEITTDSEVMRKAYLNRLLCDAGILSLEGIDPGACCDRDSQLSLWAVYTALLTHSSEGYDRMEKMQLHDTRRISALELADKYQHVVLLGDPGSGKTTFVNFVALCLAGESLKHPEANLDLMTKPVPKEEDEEEEKRQPWNHGALLPVRIILRDFAARNLPESKASASDLWKFIEDELINAELPEYAPYLKKELQEHGGLLMLDGLDEVPEADSLRLQIKAVVEDFIRTFRNCRVIVTSRIYAYQKQDWRIPGLHESVLAPFTPGQIRRFIDGWYAHFAQLKRVNPEDAQGKAEILKQAVFRNDRLKELAGRPLLLTLTASLHSWRGGSLPEKREELYAATVDLLLDRWESPKIVRDSKGEVCVVQSSLTEWLRTDRDRMRRMLNELAYNAHAKQPELTGTADITEADMVRGLWQLSANPDAKPAQLMEYLSNRAGLLLPRGVKIYSFPHRTFQEYLAACHLTDTDYPDLVAELAKKEPNRWREVALLAGAKASKGSSGSIWFLADALCYREPGNEPETGEIWGALLAGQALAETAVLDKVSPSNQAKLERVGRWMLRIIEENLLPATERVTAGNSLSVIGDTRFNPDMLFLLDDDELGFVTIPAGKFLMGTSEKDAENLIAEGFPEEIVKSEQPQHKVMLSEFAISKYPVTVAQFRVFVRDSNYKAGKRWENSPDNHPVVYVSWDDAVAYSKWLTEKLKDREWKIQLPTEAQWEKAARGNDGRIYPGAINLIRTEPTIIKQ